MNPYNRKATTSYQTAQASTTDQVALVILLYEGAVRFLKIALKKIDEKNIEGAYQNISLARNIVSELMASLDLTAHPDISNSLQQLYKYMFVRLLEANIYKDKVRVQEVISLLSNLLEGWRNASKNNKIVADTTITKTHKTTSIYG